MTSRKQSRLSDKFGKKPRKSDETLALSRALRDARLKWGLSQQELARKLGFRQRQISDLERAAMDPRLSTVQNVARALDLELTIIPRHLISVIEGLQRAGTGSRTEPMYTLDDDDDDDHDDGSPKAEPS